MDWYAIACKIRNQNQKLKEKITSLETLIDEQKEQIKVQVIKNQDYEQVINEQEETQSLLEVEIGKYEEQMAEKTQQIETQQSTVHELAQELQKIQQQIARLERECSLLQEKYNEEQNKLQQMEVENKDLRIRLQRQQRYNLQYKTALDQFLDGSSQNNRDFNSIGIKSWSENELDDNMANGNNGFGLDIDDISGTWNEEAFDDLVHEDEINPTESLDSDNEESNVKNNLEEETPENEQEEDQTSSSKPFLKLPHFGFKKKDEPE